jgi:ubiquinone/menaquinone biosynthesis C-methylase UbiE
MKNDTNGHYSGFWVDWYDDLLAGETGDIELYTSLIKPQDGPVLELATGTGRVLIELLKRGVACDGMDLSGQMLAICRKKLDAHELRTKLFEGDMTNLNFSQKYNTIFISGGSFQLIADVEKAKQSLHQIFNKLLPGGKFICDLWVPWDEIIANEQNTWKVGRVAKRPDGSKLVVSYFKQFQLREQTQTGEFRYELFEDGTLSRTQLIPMKLKWYGVDEFKMLLYHAGFSKVEIQEKSVMSSHGVSTVYIAKK